MDKATADTLKDILDFQSSMRGPQHHSVLEFKKIIEALTQPPPVKESLITGPSWPIAWEEIKKDRDGHLWPIGDSFDYREFFRLGWMACIAWAPDEDEYNTQVTTDNGEDKLKIAIENVLTEFKKIEWRSHEIPPPMTGDLYEAIEDLETVYEDDNGEKVKECQDS